MREGPTQSPAERRAAARRSRRLLGPVPDGDLVEEIKDGDVSAELLEQWCRENADDIDRDIHASNGYPLGENTAGGLAAHHGRTEALRILLRWGANPTRPYQGWMWIHGATFNGHAEAVALLIDAGTPVDARVSSLAGRPWANFTPLHFASHHGLTKMVRLLVRRGGDIRCRTWDRHVLHLKDAEAFARGRLSETGFLSSTRKKFADVANYLAAVKFAGGYAAYVREARVQLLVLRQLVARGRATPPARGVLARFFDRSLLPDTTPGHKLSGAGEKIITSARSSPPRRRRPACTRRRRSRGSPRPRRRPRPRRPRRARPARTSRTRRSSSAGRRFCGRPPRSCRWRRTWGEDGSRAGPRTGWRSAPPRIARGDAAAAPTQSVRGDAVVPPRRRRRELAAAPTRRRELVAATRIARRRRSEQLALRRRGADAASPRIEAADRG